MSGWVAVDGTLGGHVIRRQMGHREDLQVTSSLGSECEKGKKWIVNTKISNFLNILTEDFWGGMLLEKGRSESTLGCLAWVGPRAVVGAV